jgi:hypothetical protein
MMQFPKMVSSNEQNANVFYLCTYDDFIPIPGRQSALRKPQQMLGYFQHRNNVQTTTQTIQDTAYFQTLQRW